MMYLRVKIHMDLDFEFPFFDEVFQYRKFLEDLIFLIS